MESVDGKFIMRGCSGSDPDCLRAPDDLLYLIRRIGFLPLFSNTIPGFSVEEHTLAESWWTGDAASDPWEWRHVLASSDAVAYGKFFGQKAGFISKEWFPILANYRRNGYDFDALWDEGLASNRAKNVMDVFALSDKMVGNVLTGAEIAELSGEKERVIEALQMQTYLITSAFQQKKNKKGKPYGWHIGSYTTPETKWGYGFVTSDYHNTPAASWETIVGQVMKHFPAASGEQIVKVLGIRYPNQPHGLPTFGVRTRKPVKPPKPDALPYPENLLNAIGLELVFGEDKYVPLNSEQMKGLDYALGTLHQREHDMIKCRYEQHTTIRNVGERYGITGNRVRQILDKSLRKLRHPTRLVYYQRGYSETVQRREDIERRAKALTEERATMDSRVYSEAVQKQIDLIRDISIAELDFPVRIYNCLTRSEIYTLGDIIDMMNSDPNNLSKIRNLGLNGQGTVLEKLKEYGLNYYDRITFITMTAFRFK